MPTLRAYQCDVEVPSCAAVLEAVVEHHDVCTRRYRVANSGNAVSSRDDRDSRVHARSEDDARHRRTRASRQRAHAQRRAASGHKQRAERRLACPTNGDVADTHHRNWRRVRTQVSPLVHRVAHGCDRAIHPRQRATDARSSLDRTAALPYHTSSTLMEVLRTARSAISPVAFIADSNTAVCVAASRASAALT